MRVVTSEKTVYEFSELSESAQDRAIQKQAEFEARCFDPDYIYDDADRVAKILGIDIRCKPIKLMGGGTRMAPAIYWSGFWNQGDGARYEGSYAYAKGSRREIREYAPLDAELHRIADTLYGVQRRHFYCLTASIGWRGYYSHSGCMDISIDAEAPYMGDISESDCDTLRECLRDFADWIYRQLEAEYEYRTSREACIESIEANGYEFDEEGDIA